MPLSSRRIQQAAKRIACQQLETQAFDFEERLHHLSLQFRAAQLQFQAVYAQRKAVQQECLWLQHVVNTKQQVIEELLPYYPRPLTPALLYAIELY